MQWSMAGGGVADPHGNSSRLHLYRTFGCSTLVFMLYVSLIRVNYSGTSTGFPFGDYSYLSGLGYKITGLVPFTIPSWFYMGFASY